MHIGAILLAAGGSTRLGSPKQLLAYGGQTFLRRAARAVLDIGCQPVVAVLGARADEMRRELTGTHIQIHVNAHWERGMGSSVRLGLNAVRELAGSARLAGVLITVCDQPLIGAGELRTLSAAFDDAHPLVAAAYSGTVGVPAIFGRRYFDELGALPDHAGAKQTLLAHWADLTAVALSAGAIDIDTREQYERFVAR